MACRGPLPVCLPDHGSPGSLLDDHRHPGPVYNLHAWQSDSPPPQPRFGLALPPFA